MIKSFETNNLQLYNKKKIKNFRNEKTKNLLYKKLINM